VSTTDPVSAGLRLLDLHLADALKTGPESLEFFDDLMAGGTPEDLALNAHVLQAGYLEDRIPYPFSGDHLTTTQKEATP
jgi:hypothetical protein